MDFTTSALIASWAAILLLALVVSGLIRQVHQLTRERTQHHPTAVGIQPGAAAPGLAGVLEPGRDGVLLFLDADCRTCGEVLTEAAAWASRHGSGEVQLHAVYAGAPVSGGELPVTGHRPDLFEAYDAIATPFAVATDPRGRVLRSEPLGSATALLRLLDDIHPGQLRSAS
ncbi:hypothetical protein SRB5_45840 [Streptomyces sp. RB5]|uniref:Thioredoxin domain-containing protein n=1 Tax=Streptomyces smaragdinus TaxID=2585196 RepID=A0A7K0CLQ7_9ACTN|nr:hypothetical protein [Streptomyces smaragdinus]MQY14417.1 hypothetical protein [Streptomyces smaragdinus]